MGGNLSNSSIFSPVKILCLTVAIYLEEICTPVDSCVLGILKVVIVCSTLAIETTTTSVNPSAEYS